MKIHKSSPILKSKTRTGKEKFWQGHVGYEPNNSNTWYTQTSYWQESKDGVPSIVQWSDPYQAKPKNVGKVNETTAQEQAEFEFDAMVKKQRDKGYDETGTVESLNVLPMLAEKFTERKHKLIWPVFVQPKYNGQRMMLSMDGKAWSRSGKEIIPEVIAHLTSAMPLPNVSPALILDGELILPNNQLLQNTMKASKKYVKGLSEELLFVVYDIVSDEPFEDRYNTLTRISKFFPANMKKAPTVRAETEDEIMALHKEYVFFGYEGTMVRDNSAGYAIGHRSGQLLKYKDFVDAEFKIIDVLEGEGKFKGSAIFKCITPEGKEFDCTPEGTMEYRRELFQNKDALINQWLTVRYQELSKDLKPIFPIGVTIREKGEF